MRPTATQLPQIWRLSFQRKNTPPAEEIPPLPVMDKQETGLLSYLSEKFELVESHLVEDNLPPQLKPIKKAKGHLPGNKFEPGSLAELEDQWVKDKTTSKRLPDVFIRMKICLLYTSDAADE